MVVPSWRASVDQLLNGQLAELRHVHFIRTVGKTQYACPGVGVSQREIIRQAGRAVRLHERSRFVREAGRWYYVDGDIR